MQISQTLPSLRGDSGTGRYSIYGPNPEQNMLAHMTNAQGGGIMDTIMRMVPGLHTVDEDGNVRPIINTNFKLQDTGQSAFSHAVMDQNTRAYNAGGIAVQDAQSEAWRRAITGPGLIDEAVERLVPEEDRDVVKGIRDFIGSDMFSKVGVPAINGLLGYDRGEGVNVSMGRSFGVLAGIDRNAGGIFAAGREGSDVLNPRQMNWGDFLSGNYNEKRLNVQRTIDSAVQDLMYREDETKKGTLTKRGVVHGASDKLVTSIMADAMESGAIDEYLRSNPYDYKDAATGKTISMESMADVLQARDNENRKARTATANKAQASEDLLEAEARGDKSAIETLQAKIKEYDQQIDSAAKALKDIDGLVSRAAEPLVEAVTGTVSALKDFYGSETESKQALDRLTNGEGSKDRAVANRVHDQINEIKVLGMMSGVGAEAMGTQLGLVQNALGAGSGNSGRYMGATALNFQRMFANQIAARGGTAADQEELMNAQIERASSFGDSEAEAFSVLLETAKKNGAFEGRDEELSEIIDLSLTGRAEDAREAKKRLAKIGYGSEEYYSEIENDPAMLNAFRGKLTEEERNRAGELGVRIAKAEDTRMAREGTWSARERRQMAALTEAGVDTTELENDVGNRDYQAIMDTLQQAGVGPDGDKGASTAMTMLQREVEAVKKRRPDISDAEAKKIAADNFNAKGYGKLLSTETRDEIAGNRAAARYSALADAEMFRDSESGQLYMMQSTDFLQNIGAAGQDGSVTRSAFAQASRSLFDFMSTNADSGIIRDRNGNEISARDISEKQTQYDKLMKEGRYNEAFNLVNDLASNMDEESKNLRDAQLKGSYRTMDQIYMENASRMTGGDAEKFANLRSIANDTSKSDSERQRARDQMSQMMAKTQQEQDLIDEVTGYGDMAKRMNGMSREDAITYAEAFKKSQNYELSDEERAKAQEQMRELEKKNEDSAKSDLAKVIEGFQGGADEFVKALTDAGIDVKQFGELLRGIVGLAGGKVVGEGDKVGPGKTKEERLAKSEHVLDSVGKLVGGDEKLEKEYQRVKEEYTDAVEKGDYDKANKIVEKFEKESLTADQRKKIEDDYKASLGAGPGSGASARREGPGSEDLSETWYHSGEKGERNLLGAAVTAPGRAVKAISDSLFGDDSFLSNLLGTGITAADYLTGNGEAMEGAQSRKTGMSSSRPEKGGDDGKIDLLCGRLDRLISTLERDGPDRTVRP